jgi:hypothetical protein
MAIHRLVLLVVLDRADDLPVNLDDEAFLCLYELLFNLLDVGGAPPPMDRGLIPDLKEPLGVLGVAGTQQHLISSQNHHVNPTLLSARVSLLLCCPPFRTKYLPE